MSPVPKKKHTKSRTNKRRKAKPFVLPALSRCLSCKKLKRPHEACPHCGSYKPE